MAAFGRQALHACADPMHYGIERRCWNHRSPVNVLDQCRFTTYLGVSWGLLLFTRLIDVFFWVCPGVLKSGYLK